MDTPSLLLVMQSRIPPENWHLRNAPEFIMGLHCTFQLLFNQERLV